MGHLQNGTPDFLDTLQEIVDRRQPCHAPTPAQYLDEFHRRIEPIVGLLETGLTSDLEARGPSNDLMHEWSLVVAQAQDFLKALADEAKRGE